MENKHTPGLGIAELTFFNDGIPEIWFIHRKKLTDLVAKVKCNDEKEVAENAKLIAANHELLEALIAALPYVEMAEYDESYKKGAVKRMVKQIQAAIKKATN